MDFKNKFELRNVVTMVSLILMIFICDRHSSRVMTSHNNDLNSKDTLKCVIALGNDMYSPNGLKTGLTYEMLRHYSLDNNKTLIIENNIKDENYFDSLRNGSIDILIASLADSSNFEGLIQTSKTDRNIVWLVGNNQSNDAIKSLNHWKSTFISSDSYAELQHRFNSLYDPFKRIEKGMISYRLSPYDDLIKQYAAQLGWDWRLLAAVVYQESRFAISTKSNRGARGLMQLMPNTAEHYGVKNLLDPAENMKAGVSHLARLQKMYKNIEINERTNFILASYNAGEGRIADCRNFAASLDLNKNSWAVIAQTIPLMREDSILKEESVKFGKFYGFETLDYVNNINLIYNAFCEIYPS